jgi:hypothetical protein
MESGAAVMLGVLPRGATEGGEAADRRRFFEKGGNQVSK